MVAACITDEVLAAWANGNVTSDVADSIQRHIATCASCRTVAAEVARTAGSRPKPKTLGRYELREPVGAGGMGTVFVAWDPTVSRQVAVKLLHEAAIDSHRAERFRLERQVLGGLEHPHIARLLDAGETEDGQPWFAMDFIDGKPLDEACDDAKLTPKQRVELMLPVLRAVTAAHQHLVVHRDLKPSNILVDKNGEPHLVDFGIARLLEGASGLTQTGVAPMTPAYASPEQVRRESVAVTTDVYSLGVVLYELLTGVSPYETKPGDVEGVLVAIAKSDVKLPSDAVLRASDAQVASRGLTREKLRSALQGDLDAIVMMALRKEPQDRYQSVQSLTDDLVAALEGRPTLARRGDRAYRAALFVRRNRALVAGISAAFIALTIGLVATVWQARRAESERDLAQSRFDQVRQLARAVLFKYHDGIVDLPGSTTLRQELVKDAQGYLEALAVQSKSDVTLQQELADSYLKLGDIQGDPFASNLGDTPAAKVSYLKGRELAQAVLKQQPTDRAARRSIAASYEKLAAIDEVSGSLDDARTGYLAAIDIDAKLLAEQPDSVDQLAALARDEISAGQLLITMGKLEESQPHLEKSLELGQRVAERRPDMKSRASVGATLLSLADLYANTAQLERAIASGAEAKNVFDALVTEFPDAQKPQRGQRAAWDQLVYTYRLSNQGDKALEWAHKSLESSRARAARDADNAQAQRDLTVSLSSLATLLNSLERIEELKPVDIELLTRLRAACEQDPTNTQNIRNLSSSLVRAAVSTTSRGEFDDAERLLAEHAQLVKRLRELGAEDLPSREEQATALEPRTFMLMMKKRFAEAKAVNQQQLDALMALSKEAPDSKRLLNTIGIVQNERVRLMVRAAEHSHARADWEEAQRELTKAIATTKVVAEDEAAFGILLQSNERRNESQVRIEAALAGKPMPPLPPL